MTAKLQTRSVASALSTDIYISATPGEEMTLQNQAREIFSRIHDILRSNQAHILQERVFSTQPAVETLRRARSAAYGDLDDGVAPSFLVASEGLSGPIAGVQVHAVSSSGRPEVIELEGNLCGRILRVPGRAYLTLSGISVAGRVKGAPPAIRRRGTFGTNEAAEQAKIMMEKAQAVLKKFGADFLSVPRTWMWLKDILSWYDDFNRVRTAFFTERGVIGAGSRQAMPASTGIGLGPANGGCCAMDLVAVLEPTDCTQYLQVTNKQHSALDYGSAFSRAASSIMPAGRTVFVSGTASIDAGGATTHLGNAAGQINATIENVRAVLSEMQCRDDDVVQVIAYCKTVQVEKVFNSIKDKLQAGPSSVESAGLRTPASAGRNGADRVLGAWPWLTVICDICRPDLLFEIEAAAVPKSQNP
jgi:enamine deaminase RidA (YjgF/YER057c/UK114 family)